MKINRLAAASVVAIVTKASTVIDIAEFGKQIS